MTTTEQTPQTKIILGKFPGFLGGFQSSAFIDLKAAGFDQETAHKIALDYGADLGNAIRNAGDAGLTSKIAKAKKSGESRITLGGGGATTTSRCMSVIRLCQQQEGLYKEDLVKSRKVDLDTLSTNLREYVDICDLWVEKNEFALS